MIRCLVLSLALLIASSATAQQRSVRGWDTTESDGTSMAFIVFDDNLALVVGCVDGQYRAMVSGLPQSRTYERFLHYEINAERSGSPAWFTGSNRTIAMSPDPADFARDLRPGGALRLTDRTRASATHEWVLEVPPAESEINATLAACGRPPNDPRVEEIAALQQDGLPTGFTWSIKPEAEFPDVAVPGYVLVYCVAMPDGSLDQCTVETQYPADEAFTEAALNALPAARLGRSDGSAVPLPRRLVAIPFNFRFQ